MGKGAGESANYFLTTLFPSNQLQIMDYNRVVKDLNGLAENDFIEKIKTSFLVEKNAVKPYLRKTCMSLVCT